MDNYKIEGNKDLARDPKTKAIINVNNIEHQQYVSIRRIKNQKNETVNNLEGELINLKSEMNEIKSLLKELVNGN